MYSCAHNCSLNGQTTPSSERKKIKTRRIKRKKLTHSLITHLLDYSNRQRSIVYTVAMETESVYTLLMYMYMYNSGEVFNRISTIRTQLLQGESQNDCWELLRAPPASIYMYRLLHHTINSPYQQERLCIVQKITR